MNKANQWSSRFGFILASAGAAIGLGAIWKFPYVTGTSGGGAFFFLFILFTLFIGMPLLLAEFIIGRNTGKEAISAYKAIAPGSNWAWIGRIGVVSCLVLLSFYSVVGGWVLIYALMSISGQLIGQSYGSLFDTVIGNPFIVLGGQLLFLVMTVFVVSKGVQHGIERANKYMMPLLFISFLIIVGRSLTLENATEGLLFFLKPDFSEITASSVLYALGQSFFALCVGLSCMVTYSSYLGKEVSLTKSASSIAFLNLFVSLLAGLAIFPAVFSFGLEPAEGPGLLFVILPAVFEQMPFGTVFLSLFLVLFLFATLTSAFSLLEIIVASLTKEEQEKRVRYSWLSGLIVFLVGIPSALSFGVFSHVSFGGRNLFDVADFFVSNVMLPLGSLAIAIFLSFKMKKEVLYKEFMAGGTISTKWFELWLFLVKYVLPIIIVIVFINLLRSY
ncbi:sodium-dependent transporter [Metabacillus iocasae]|uniref:Transporter n=1 Tax=Priestia iocasae TaxID=2291674 RepID=A0ABS2QS20_9BACI|nr:sodium-dependent transporter [Metabacillus iocasae]MBM7702200.1 NSS family neurotransmitter:Na+ symporter [Metabacillus iocasae]